MEHTHTHTHTHIVFLMLKEVLYIYIYLPQCVKEFCPRGFTIYKPDFSGNRPDLMWDPLTLLFDGYRDFSGSKVVGA